MLMKFVLCLLFFAFKGRIDCHGMTVPEGEIIFEPVNDRSGLYFQFPFLDEAFVSASFLKSAGDLPVLALMLSI